MVSNPLRYKLYFLLDKPDDFIINYIVNYNKYIVKKLTMKQKAERSPVPLAVQDEKSFGRMLEGVAYADIGEGGYMRGSLAGESWKAFLQGLRLETVSRLKAYRGETFMNVEFRASTLQPYCEERMRIEREYVRGLVKLYGNAERAYKSLSG